MAEPRFKIIREVAHSFRGARPNGLEGAIVHYDAGRSRSAGRGTDPQAGAMTTMMHGQARQFAYAAIARDGTILLPANMDWERWGSHAGTSRCPATNRAGVSRFYVGIEVNSPGLVLPTDDPDRFVPWFDAVRDASGQAVLDARGRARIKDPNGEIYRRAELRVAARGANIHAGTYVPFTADQMDALTGLLLWLKARNPAKVRFDRVFGHDEVAPTRKLDPGGCLGAPGTPALTMADYRARLAALWAARGSRHSA